MDNLAKSDSLHSMTIARDKISYTENVRSDPERRSDRFKIKRMENKRQISRNFSFSPSKAYEIKECPQHQGGQIWSENLKA
jgi:hypothetical protein